MDWPVGPTSTEAVGDVWHPLTKPAEHSHKKIPVAGKESTNSCLAVRGDMYFDKSSLHIDNVSPHEFPLIGGSTYPGNKGQIRVSICSIIELGTDRSSRNLVSKVFSDSAFRTSSLMSMRST